MKERLQRWIEGGSRLLLRLGFTGISEQARRQLSLILIASIALHLLALAVFGSFVVMQNLRGERTVFVAPPPMKTYQPRELEHKVKVQQRQRSSSRPAMTPRLVAMKPSDLAMPEIEVNPKSVKTAFQPKFQQVSGVGMGVGLGTGYGLGGFGMGVAQFDFFGIRGRGDRVAILVDVSESMIEEEVGGPAGFERVKARLGQLVDALNEQALFNVVAFAEAARTMKPQMVIANAANKQAAKDFLRPFNTGGSLGLKNGNVNPAGTGLRALGGFTRLDLALTAAFQQGADTILVISDGIPWVNKPLSPLSAEEQGRWQAQLDQWNRQNAGAIEQYQRDMEAYNAALSKATYREEKVWVPARARKEGQAAREGHYVTRRVPNIQMHRPRAPAPPQRPGAGDDRWTLEDFLEHFKILQEEYYAKKGKKPPVVHCIGYQIDREGGQFLRDFSRAYKGQYRRVGN